MPEEGIDFSSRSELLSDDEMIRLARMLVQLGVNKIRLTGGEPFARKGIERIIKELSALDISLHITSNATLLDNHYDLLSEVNIKSLNISIDSLDRDRFWMITRRDAYQKVIDSIIKCRDLGIPTKLNTVVMKGVNDDELPDFVAFGQRHGVEVRFIEAMPFNDDDGNKPVFMPATEIEQVIRRAYPSLSKLDYVGHAASDTYTIGDYRVGIIPSYSRSLCASCNRIRLTPQGELLTCLYATSGVSLRDLIRARASDEVIIDAITSAVSQKKRSGHEEEALRSKEVFESMTTIGG